MNNETEQLKRRIDHAGPFGVETKHIRDDYEPIGRELLRAICDNGEYVQRRYPPGSFDSVWMVFKKGMEPY
mgnify:CR=1 FL=1